MAIAERESNKEFVFFAIGFETTAPATALQILKGPPNLSFFVSHRRIPPAMEFLLGIGDLHFDGYIAPGHVSVIIGEEPYRIFPSAYKMPTVIAGFEPVDVLLAVYIILRQLKSRKADLVNEYRRVVRKEGNIAAQRIMNEVFAIFEVDGVRLAFTTDSFVVAPIFFPGGDIGLLAVNGTVNDLAVGGAIPLFLSAAFILEEGFYMEDLERQDRVIRWS